MNIGNLIENAPELVGKLNNIGLTDLNISDLASEIGNQIGGGDGLDLTDILGALQSENFMSKLDIPGLAEKVLISPELAQQAVSLIAPVVESFGGGSKGMLGKVVGSLFSRS